MCWALLLDGAAAALCSPASPTLRCPCLCAPLQPDAPASAGAASISLGGASVSPGVPTDHSAACLRRWGGKSIPTHEPATGRCNPPGSGMAQVWVMSLDTIQAARAPFTSQCMCEAARTLVPGVLSGGRQYSSTTCRGTAHNMLEVSRAAVAGMRSNHRPRVSAWCPGLSCSHSRASPAALGCNAVAVREAR